MSATYVISIDVGIKNMGMCVYDAEKEKVVYWNAEALVTGGKYAPMRNVEYVYAFIQKHSRYFSQARAVVVERQMRVNMRIIEAVFKAVFYPICTVLAPRNVKMHFDLCRNNYRLNKQAAVQWMHAFTKDHANFFDGTLSHTADVHTKQDDLADALVMLVYFLDTYDFNSESPTNASIINVCV